MGLDKMGLDKMGLDKMGWHWTNPLSAHVYVSYNWWVWLLNKSRPKAIYISVANSYLNFLFTPISVLVHSCLSVACQQCTVAIFLLRKQTDMIRCMKRFYSLKVGVVWAICDWFFSTNMLIVLHRPRLWTNAQNFNSSNQTNTKQQTDKTLTANSSYKHI